MSYSLGFDGGGTHTECVVLGADGKVVGAGKGGGPSNPLRAGYDVAFQSLNAAAGEALSSAKLTPANIAAVCAGLAGAARRQVIRRTMVFLAQEFPAAIAQVTTDYEIALEAAVGSGFGIEEPGVVLIAGTGSIAYGRNSRGETARAGGHGPWIGDEGSAFDIGRRAIAAIARSRDEGEPDTALAKLIPQTLASPDWDELVERIMKTPDAIFPAAFPTVLVAADAGDRAAQEILRAAAMALASLAATVTRRLAMTDREFPLVKCGGLFGHNAIFDAQVDAALAGASPRARISKLEVSPAVGAARMAARLVHGSAQAEIATG